MEDQTYVRKRRGKERNKETKGKERVKKWENKRKEKWKKDEQKEEIKRGKKQRKKTRRLEEEAAPLIREKDRRQEEEKKQERVYLWSALLFEHMGIAEVLLGVLLISPLAWPATLCKTTSATSDVDIIHNCVDILFLGALSPSNSFQLQLVVSNMLLALPLAELSEFDAKCTVQRWSSTCSERIWRIIEWQGVAADLRHVLCEELAASSLRPVKLNAWNDRTSAPLQLVNF